MSFRKFLFPLLLLLPAACAASQKEATLQAFLSEFKECSKIESKSFEDSRPSDSAYIDKELCKQYFPIVNKDSTEEGSIWLKGSYIKHGNLIIAMFKRWCQDYDDKFNNLFVEYSVDLYTLIVFSAKGEVLNSRTIGYEGGGSYGTTYFARITPSDDPLTFRVEQATLDGDGMLMKQYKEDLIYTVATHEYTISPEGKVVDKPLGTKKEHRRPRGADSHNIKSFEQFKSYFVKCEKPYLRDSLFTMYKGRQNQEPIEDLPMPDCLDFIPDTIINSEYTPKQTSFLPYSYIETPERCFFFVSEEYGPYHFYFKILEFDKAGHFVKQIKVFFYNDYGDIYGDDIDVILDHRLKKYEHLWNTSR